jgi:hypothetical protein
MHGVASAIALGLFLCAPLAHADEQPTVSARVVSYESVETLTRTACDLVAIADVGGHARLFDVSVDGKRCSSLDAQDDAIVLRVRIEPLPDDQRIVVFEADVPEGMPSKQMLAAVDNAAREMLDRINGKKPRIVVPLAHESRTSSSSNGAHTGGTALIALGAVGFGGAALIGLVALVDSAGHSFGCGVAHVVGSSCGSQDLSGYGIAAGIAAGIGAVFLISGAVVVSLTPDKSVSAQLGPTGGSLRVTF